MQIDIDLPTSFDNYKVILYSPNHNTWYTQNLRFDNQDT